MQKRIKKTKKILCLKFSPHLYRSARALKYFFVRYDFSKIFTRNSSARQLQNFLEFFGIFVVLKNFMLKMC